MTADVPAEATTTPALQPPDQAAFTGRGLHGRLVQGLGVRIVSGDLRPGTVIDLDRFAAEEQVSRTVVREAVKVLAGKGLLDARPRHGTFVRDRAGWSMMDAEVMRWRCLHGPDAQLLRELMEIRAILEPAIAHHAAVRRSEEHLAALREALATMHLPELSLEEHVEADLRFHWVLAAAAGNELLAQLSALLQPAQRSRDVLAFEHLTDGGDFLATHTAVVDHVAARQPEAAEAAMRELIVDASEDIAAILHATTDEGPA